MESSAWHHRTQTDAERGLSEYAEASTQNPRLSFYKLIWILTGHIVTMLYSKSRSSAYNEGKEVPKTTRSLSEES